MSVGDKYFDKTGKKEREKGVLKRRKRNKRERE